MICFEVILYLNCKSFFKGKKKKKNSLPVKLSLSDFISMCFNYYVLLYLKTKIRRKKKEKRKKGKRKKRVRLAIIWALRSATQTTSGNTCAKYVGGA